MCDLSFANTAAFCDQHIFQLTVLYNRAWQKACMSIDRCFGIIKIEWRVGVGQFQIGLIEGTNRSNILPISVEVKAIYLMRLYRLRDNVPAEIIQPRVCCK